jgi:hypothetical protein
MHDYHFLEMEQFTKRVFLMDKPKPGINYLASTNKSE